jgi:hypothetical protein
MPVNSWGLGLASARRLAPVKLNNNPKMTAKVAKSSHYSILLRLCMALMAKKKKIKTRWFT